MTIHTGDCLEVMPTMPDNSVDAVVTDPPYGLEFMGKEWDKLRNTWEAEPGRYHNDTNFLARGDRVRYQAGKPMQEWHEAWAREAFRLLKPGGHLLAFGGTRTYHRLASAIEDAGFEIRDTLVWAYASGFPKSLDVGKALPDWKGWGTALKPAWEPIVLARKPLIGPVARNVTEWGTGGLNIDGTRIGGPDGHGGGAKATSGFVEGYEAGDGFTASSQGRWPANVILTAPIFDGGVEGVVGGGTTSPRGHHRRDTNNAFGLLNDDGWVPNGEPANDFGDSGTYSRFFLIPKADRADREPVLRGQLIEGKVAGRARTDGRQWDIPGSTASNGKRDRGNTHPTVKPTELMRHLVRLVTPPGGTVLDPFLGSGTTGIACELEGFAWVGIEKEPEYVAIAEARLNGTQRGLGLDVPAPTSRPPKTHPDLSKHQPKRRAVLRELHRGMGRD